MDSPHSPRTFNSLSLSFPSLSKETRDESPGYRVSIQAQMVLIVASVNTVSDSKCPGMVMTDAASGSNFGHSKKPIPISGGIPAFLIR